jgi:hypothetical protein
VLLLLTWRIPAILRSLTAQRPVASGSIAARPVAERHAGLAVAAQKATQPGRGQAHVGKRFDGATHLRRRQLYPKPDRARLRHHLHAARGLLTQNGRFDA